MIFRKFLILFAMVLPIGCGNSSGDSDNRSNADAELGALIVKLLECDLDQPGDPPALPGRQPKFDNSTNR